MMPQQLFVLVLWSHNWFFNSYDYPQVYDTKVDCLYALHIEQEVNHKHGQCYATIEVPAGAARPVDSKE